MKLRLLFLLGLICIGLVKTDVIHYHYHGTQGMTPPEPKHNFCYPPCPGGTKCHFGIPMGICI